MQKVKDAEIVVIATFFWPVSGDVEDYPYNIARMLKESRTSFIVETPNIWPDGKNVTRPLEDEFRGIHIKRFPVYSNITWFTKLWFPRFSEKTKIIHSCGGYRHPHMFIAFLRRGKAKFLLSPFFPMHPRKNPLINIAIWLIDNSLGRYVISHSECCFAETRQEEDWLKKMGAKRVVILPNSLPEDAFIKGDGKGFRKKYGITNKMIFSLGRQVPIKNFEELIEILPEIDATLVIGGEETEYTRKCREIAKNLNVEEKILWLGFVDSKQKRDAYAACDVYISSSIRESLGTTLLEAMAQEKPVIGTNAGGIPEIVPDRSCLYEQGNKEELIKKINTVFENKKFNSKIGLKGYRKAQQFRFKKIKEIYIKAIRPLLA